MIIVDNLWITSKNNIEKFKYGFSNKLSHGNIVKAINIQLSPNETQRRRRRKTNAGISGKPEGKPQGNLPQS